MAELNHCRRHKIEFTLFCQECKIDTCLTCYMENHRSHKVTSSDSGKQAALKISKDSALNCMAKLEEHKVNLEKHTRELTQNQKIMTRKLHSISKR